MYFFIHCICIIYSLGIFYTNFYLYLRDCNRLITGYVHAGTYPMLACLDLLYFLPVSHAVVGFWAVLP